MGIIRRFVDNPVAANMIMLVILGGGLLTGLRVPRELFPEFSTDVISVTVAYPRAAPADIERGIVLKVEEAVEGLEGIDEITSESREGLGVVLLSLKSGADVRKVLDRVRSEVDKIDFPENAEDPVVVEVTLRRPVIMVAVAGDAPERALRDLAEEIRDEIADLPEVSQVSVSGVRDLEISVEVSEQALRRHGLTLADVAAAIRATRLDLPAGSVKTRAGEVSVRVAGQRFSAEEFRDVPVLRRPDGTLVRVGDVASVRETFKDQDIGGQFDGKPAALVTVFKTPEEDSIKIARAVKRYVYGSPGPPAGLLARALYEVRRLLGREAPAVGKRDRVPAGITVQTWADMSKLIDDRLNMLVRNGLTGLVLVFCILWVFLGARLSFWVALGIPVALMGAVLYLHLTGMTLNMMSMFALIMALGLIVDDAIVVGENVYSWSQRGAGPVKAAAEGTREVLLPVIGAVTTTWLAFVPLMFIPGVMGKFVGILPVMVIVALAFSLLECVLILPAHLAHSLGAGGAGGAGGSGSGRTSRLRERLDRGIQRIIDGAYLPLFRRAMRLRYVVLAGLLASAVLVGGAVAGGRIRVTPFPKVESDTLLARLILPPGTPLEKTARYARRIALAAQDLNRRFAAENGRPVVRSVYALLGQQSMGGESGSHVAEIIVELLSSEQRKTKSPRLVEAWRRAVGPVPEALSLSFGGLRGGPGGTPLEIRLLGPGMDALKPLAERLERKLATFPGVTDIADDALPGKMELRIPRLKRAGYALNMTLESLGRQVRDAIYGRKALTIQRGREEIDVMVRYPRRHLRTLGDVEEMRIRTPSGRYVRLGELAEVVMERGYTTLRRVQRRSVVTVSADVDEDVANAEKILSDLGRKGGFFQQLLHDNPQVSISLRGQREQLLESIGALYVWFPLALLGIYALLAGIFRSYAQPVIIMLAIPFGLIGAVVGHWAWGYDVTLLSMFGMVALTGIVVNDSLVLIDFINRRIRAGGRLIESVQAGARQRFRPIVLTTATTVAGMAPLLGEPSFQAQFLKPMVVSVAFGLMLATGLTLLAVPCLFVVGNDLRRVLHWLGTREWVGPEQLLRREPRDPPREDPQT